MTIKQTSLYKRVLQYYTLCDSVTCNTKEGVPFTVSVTEHAPNKEYIIKESVKPFMRDAIEYVTLSQLNNCNCVIMTTRCASSYGCFNATIRVISYETCVCTVGFMPHKPLDNIPYCNVEFGVHWNYSKTTVQQLYKFLRKYMGMTDLNVKTLEIIDMRKRDKEHPDYKSMYTYDKYNMLHPVSHSLYTVRFCDSIAVSDYELHGAYRLIDRYCKRGRINYHG